MVVEEACLSIDDAFAFACRLRGHPAGMNDSGVPDVRYDPTWQVKVYNGGRRLPLTGAFPWWMQTSPAPEGDPILRLGALLFDAVGVSRVRWNLGGAVLSSPQHPELVWRGTHLSTRRPVPSGGAMYPTEVYIAALASSIGASIFHYDPARHELTDLAHPCPAGAVRAALGLGHNAPLSQLALILTHRFCKNLQKYRNFAYRLGAVDVGVVLGRLFACGLRAFGQAEVHVDFDDAALNAMCGLSGQDESAYAVILLGEPQSAPCPGAEPGLPSPPPVLERGNPARPSSLFAAMHVAACRIPKSLSAREETPALQAQGPPENNMLPDQQVVPLPVPRSEAIVERRELLCRTSNGAWFTGSPVNSDVLATVLQRTYEDVAKLVKACPDGNLPVVALYCAVDNVVGIPSGWYRYEPNSHTLVPTGAGYTVSPAVELQQALYAATVDLERSAFSLHFATVVDFRSDRRGVRAYRVQQLFVGAAIDAATRWSTAMGAGSHPLHGFDAHRVDNLYGLTGTRFGVQAQVSIGNVRPAGILEGSVVS
jgi:SagB-type dehydrogenase family enzyme